MITLYSCSPDPATIDQKVLSSFFTSSKSDDGVTTLERKSNGPSRGFLRILFPKFVVKKSAAEAGAAPTYRLKPDGVATFMLFVATAVSLIAAFSPSEELPLWQPLLLAGWFALWTIREIVKTKTAFARSTNGEPLESSDVVNKVLAMLDAEQEAGNNQP